jgi:hypothetical protein
MVTPASGLLVELLLPLVLHAAIAMPARAKMTMR